MRLLITAGPSREYLDDVRYLSNASSGRLGIELARAAAARHHSVDLALGPTHLAAPSKVQLHRFTSAIELDEITAGLWPEVDAFVATAAVADYRPESRLAGKRKKSGDVWTLELVRTPDVLWNRSRDKGDRVLVGFALESDQNIAEAERKLLAKRLDLIILNGPANLGSELGEFLWIEASGPQRRFESATKPELAREIVTFLESRLNL